jgi:hypothetical protein
MSIGTESTPGRFSVEVMQAIIKETMNQPTVSGYLIITLLDSEVVGQIHGNLLESALSYLINALEQHQEK